MASTDHELQQAKAEVERLRQHMQALFERTHDEGIAWSSYIEPLEAGQCGMAVVTGVYRLTRQPVWLLCGGRLLPEPDQCGCARLVGYPDQAFGLVTKELVGSLDDAGPGAVVVVV